MAKAIPFTLFQKTGLETRNRSLRYDMNAMADFESATGMGLAQLMSTNAVFACTRALLWSGLKRDDRALTIERAGDLMQQYSDLGFDIKDLLEACMNAAIEQKAVPGLRKLDAADEEKPEGGANPPPSSFQNGGTTTGLGPVTSDS